MDGTFQRRLGTVGTNKDIQCIVTKAQTRKSTGPLSLSLYKAVMHLECSPFLEKERANSTDVPVCCLFYSALISRKKSFCYNTL